MIYECIKDFTNNIPSEGVFLSLDMGESSIGMALCDPGRIIASPYTTYKRQNTRKDTGYIKRISLENKIVGLVIGLPLELSGLENENCTVVRKFAEKILKKINLPIFLQDERFSTSAVTNDMRSDGVKRRKRHNLDDQLAACYILQTTIDCLN